MIAGQGAISGVDDKPEYTDEVGNNLIGSFDGRADIDYKATREMWGMNKCKGIKST